MSHAVLCCAVLRRAGRVLRHAVLRCAVLRHIVLCCEVLCCAVPCYAILCRAVPRCGCCQCRCKLVRRRGAKRAAHCLERYDLVLGSPVPAMSRLVALRLAGAGWRIEDAHAATHSVKQSVIHAVVLSVVLSGI
jgi:hypothetical protein